MAPGRLGEPHSDSDEEWTVTPRAVEEDEDLLEPIAVVGFALKFPQDATSPDGFWKMLQDKVNAMTEVPPDRFDIDTLYHPSKWSSLPLRGGHYLKQDLGGFDAEFFGINPSEATVMDPAQRILLETTYHAFESAGLRCEDLRGSNTSVHTGCFTSDYMQQLLGDPERPPAYSAVGGNLSMLANRVSWFYDLMGPSVNLDSACSSSAMAVDQTCQLLRSGQTNLGIAAGCNLTIDPNFTNLLSNMQFLSKDSRSYAFDDRANGYARGEGVGVVLLQTLSQALRDGNTIRAVIRASGSNQDGRTPTVTQPNSRAQMQLIRDTYRRAGLSLKHTRFFEAHGTGTAVGDPIEARAIADVFEEYRDVESPLYVGALKSNIGHLEGASGIAALIKTILVLEKGMIVPNANFVSLNPKISRTDSCLSFPTTCFPWPSSFSGVRRASINCFGYGGSNCHLVVDDALSFLSRRGLCGRHQTLPSSHGLDLQHGMVQKGFTLTNGSATTDSETVFSSPRILVWSAATEGSLDSVVQAWQSYCVEKSEQIQDPVSIEDLTYTLDARRSPLAWRSYAIVHSQKGLNSLVSTSSGRTQRPDQSPRLAFIFTGQGAQWFAMGRELLQYHLFSEVIEEAEATLHDFGCTWSVKEELLRPEAESRINEPQFAQPLCAILQVGIVDLLREAGVIPRAVVGHSMGEIAAAYCTGAISRRSAFKLAYFRGAFFAKVPERTSVQGGMLAVGLSSTSILPYFEKVKAVTPGFNLSLACINSPKSVTVSGNCDQLKLLEAELHASSVFVRKLRVNAAYHSPQLNCIVQDCLEHFQPLESGWSEHYVPMISTVSASTVTSKELRNPGYWVKNMVSPVQFAGAIEHLCTLDSSYVGEGLADRLIEVGPHATLKLPISEAFQQLPNSQNLTYDSVLYRGKPAGDTLLQVLGNLFCLGYPVNLRYVNEQHMSWARSCKTLTDGPEYPFDHAKRYWYESQLTRNQRFRKNKHLPLLGATSADWNSLRPQWRYCIRPVELPWLRDHRLDGRTVYPASAFISMALAAASQMSDPTRSIRAYVVRRASFRSPVAPPLGSDDMETRLSLTPIDTNASSAKWVWQFEIFASHGTDWTEVCTGLVESVYDQDIGSESAIIRAHRHRLQELRRLCNDEKSSSDVYKALEKCGYQYGTTFRGMQTVQHNRDDLASTIIDLNLPCEVDQDHQDYIMHPASLDAFIQLSLVALTSGAEVQELLHVPTAIEKLWISAKGVKAGPGCLKASVKLEEKRYRSRTFSMFALDEEEVFTRLAMDGLELSAINGQQPKEESQLPALEHAFNMRTVLDIEMLSPSEVNQWLDRQCGPDVIGPAQFWNDLRAYVRSMLPELQARYQGKTDFSVDRSHLSSYLNWIDWQISKSASSLPPASCQELENKIGTQSGVGKLMVEVAHNIQNVLDGKMDVLQLLFENDLVKDFYQDQAFGSVYESKLETFVRQLALKRPRMDILEIGGGTGSFTRHLLRALETSSSCPHLYNSYTFTDVSPMFFEKAKEEFAEHQHQMTFRKLDVGADFIEQGYREAQYDLIVASNVLHVTQSIAQTIAEVRKLLRPGGKLILHETVVPDNPEIGFAFGLIQGWWSGAESYRSMSPLITEDRWVSLLCENGFATPDVIIRDFTDDDSHHMSIISATAVEETQSQLNSNITIVSNGESVTEAALACAVQDTLASHAIPANTISLAEASCEGVTFEVLVFLVDAFEPFFLDLSEDSFKYLKAVIASAKKVLWVTGGGNNPADPAFGMIDGFVQVLRIEFAHLEISTLALNTTSSNPRALKASGDHIVKVLDQLQLTKDPFDREDYLVDDDKLTVRRAHADERISRGVNDLLEHKTTETCDIGCAHPFTVKSIQSGGNAGFEIVAEADPGTPTAEDIEIEVCAVGLDREDLQNQHGGDPRAILGVQGSGVVRAVEGDLSFQPGDRVCFLHDGALRSTVRVNANLVSRIPKQVSFSEAAVLPKSHLCASWLLHERLRLRPSDSILILGRNSSLSRASFEQAYQIGCRIAVAVFSDKEKKLFEELYPGKISVYPVQGGFEEFQCQRTTFDAVLDLSGHSIQFDTLQCISKYGQVVRVEDPSRNKETSLWMPRIPTNVSFCTTTEESILTDQLERTALSLGQAIRPSFSLDSSYSSTTQMFSLSEVSKALDHLRTSPESQAVVDFTGPQDIELVHHGKASYCFSSDATYIIAGGFGDLGRCLVKWMVSHGTRNLIFLSRSGPSTDDAQQMVQELEQSGVVIKDVRCDVTDWQSLESSLKPCMQTMPAVRGCIQASGVLKDIMYEQMSFDDWKAVVNPKTRGSWNLHEILPSELDFFILIASAIGIVGQATQINYAAANTYEDALARYRMARGENALSLDLGVLRTGGLLSRNPDLLDRVTSSGHHIPMSEQEIQLLMELCFDGSLERDPLVIPQILTGVRSPVGCTRTGIPIMESMKYPFWSQLQPIRSDSEDFDADPEVIDAYVLLKAAKTEAAACEAAAQAIIHRLAAMILIEPADIDPEQTLLGNAVDSLCAIELRNWIIKVFGIELPMFDLLGGSTISELGSTIAEQWRKDT